MGRGIMRRGHPSAYIVAPVRHAVFVEFGTDEHPISPVRRRALAFPGRGRGMVIIGPRLKSGRWLVRGGGKTGLTSRRSYAVKHPGTEAAPFFFPTINRHVSRLGLDLAQAFRRELSRLPPARR